MVEHVILAALAALVTFVILRLTYYHSKVMAATRHLNAFLAIIEATSERNSDRQAYARAHTDLAERWPEITELLEQARIRVLFGRNLGFGDFQPSGSKLIWQILGDTGFEQRRGVLEAFYQARGYFRARRNESISPIFWIESLINWPRAILRFLGFSSDGMFAKLLQVAVLILEVAAGIILVANNFQ